MRAPVPDGIQSCVQGCAVCILLLLLPLVPRQEGGGTDALAQVHPLASLPAGQQMQRGLATEPLVLHKPQCEAVLHREMPGPARRADGASDCRADCDGGGGNGTC